MRAGDPPPPLPRGGRRRQMMSVEEEKAFLEPWAARAATAGVVIVPPLHEALEKHLGRTIHPSQTYRLLARHGWRRLAPDSIHPKADPEKQEDWKKLPEVVAAHLASPAAWGKRPRLMLQDEARFGRMSRSRRCWAPPGTRPVMSNGYEPEFTYVYGAVSPMEGEMEWRVTPK